MLRSQAAQESAEVVSQTMQNAQVQFTAREFSKEWGWMIGWGENDWNMC